MLFSFLNTQNIFLEDDESLMIMKSKKFKGKVSLNKTIHFFCILSLPKINVHIRPIYDCKFFVKQCRLDRKNLILKPYEC